MWQDSAAVFPPCIPATPDELLVLLSKRADRTLSPRGIELGGMFYTSDELMALRANWPATTWMPIASPCVTTPGTWARCGC